MAGEYDGIEDSDLDSIVNAIENNSIDIGNTSDNSDSNEDLEDTESNEDVADSSDTEVEADDADAETDTTDTDDDEGEYAQAEKDDAYEDEEELDDEDHLSGSEDDDGVDDDVEEDDQDDDDQTDGNDDEIIEGDDDTDEDLSENSDDELANEFYRQTQEVEYIVNGKKMKGLGTVEDMVKARQMSGGLNEKFKAIKDAKPVLAPLKDRGLITDTEKFNLLMQIADGDVEAHKELMRQQGIDPIDIDMEVSNYEAKNSVTSNEEIMYNDTLDIAKQYGVEDKFNKVVLNDWDSESLNQFFKSPETAATIGTALAEQIENGLYDQVMTEVVNMESLDVNGTFAVKSDIDKYNEASQIVNQRNASKQPVVPKETNEIDTSKVEAAKKKIEEKRKKATYTKKLEEKNAQANAKRKKASASSTRKTKVAPAKKADPYSLEGDDLDSFVNELMNTFR